MSTGQIVFYAGIGLLVVTIILAVIFMVKKPVYHPENAAVAGGENRTMPLRSGYPTDPLTRRRDTPAAPAGTIPLQETEKLAQETEKLAQGTVPLEETEAGGTEVLSQGTEQLAAGTIPLSEETAPLQTIDKTVLLNDITESSEGETMVLDSTLQPGDTESIGGTTPLSEN